MPRHVDPVSRRREIVYALWMVIHRQGIAAASLRAVAAEAGISIGRIQHYFADKDALVRAGCREMVALAQTEHVADPQVEGEPVADPRADLHRWAAHAVPTTENSRVAVSVWHAYLAYVGADPVIAATVREAVAGSVDHTASLLVRARGRDGVRDDDRSDALRLVALGDGLAARVLVGALTPEDATALLDAEVDRLLAAR